VIEIGPELASLLKLIAVVIFFSFLVGVLAWAAKE